ncbi:extracellular solute-binding protein [Acetobacteraceae bacterium KSS8]|uniref:Extracellular solute-binding protein n=1 Tax=Endosaccharibacter trunci TaxID=2812733 RepID=A0ABT1WAY9_9PROT|nr:extracellular solute-binding protein [Acetobacteraceae bacterium KSS8]
MQHSNGRVPRRGFLLGAAAGALSRPAFAEAAVGDVSVLHAGSLVALMEHGIVPAFHRQTGGTVLAFAGGSNGLANQIRNRLRRGDVFLSASPTADDQLAGAANGDWVGWYVAFARSPVVLGYDPHGAFAAALAHKPWYEALQQPGLRIGRTDPALDPKGAFTVELMRKAETVLGKPGLAQRVLGAPNNPEQVRPEQSLVGRLQSGAIDVGFFYSTEAADLHLATVVPPPEMSVSALYTVTILRDAPNPAGAERFVTFLLGPEGAAVMRAHGLDRIAPVAHGDLARIPASVRAMLSSR